SHAVGHGRHSHGRIPSHGKNLNKLSKLTAAHAQEEHVRLKEQPKAKAQTPSTSPATSNLKHESSNGNLVHSNSKVPIRRNASNLSQKRNKSSSKLGNQSNPDKAARKSSEKTRTNGARFTVGNDEQDDAWTEADSSQSPDVARRASMSRGQAQSREPPSPDGPPLRSPTQLPDSPPQSPPTNGHERRRSPPHPRERNGTDPNPPDAEIVTKRLLGRNTASSVQPQTSAISATITPSGSSGSPAFNFSQDATLRNDQSMPSDGVSRFLNTTGSSSANATPASLAHHLNSAFNGANRGNEKQQQQHQNSSLPSISPNHATDQQSNRSNHTSSPASSKRDQNAPSRSSSPPPPLHNTHKPRGPQPSPFASAAARDHQPHSLTQQKLDLQRESATREPAHAPAIQPPVSSAQASFANLSLTNSHDGSIEDRKRKQWDQADTEYTNARRFVGVVGKGVERLGKKEGRAIGGKEDGNDDGGKGVAGGVESGRKKEDSKNLVVSMSAESQRGRVRFEVGDDGAEGGDGESDGGGLEGLLRRMWEGDGQSAGED
ncbi:MAG: hypothetical protein L6R41_002203, partial [Letrouitia leprolyta]